MNGDDVNSGDVKESSAEKDASLSLRSRLLLLGVAMRDCEKRNKILEFGQVQSVSEVNEKMKVFVKFKAATASLSESISIE